MNDDELMEPANPLDTLRKPSGRHAPPGLVFHIDVMVSLGPVMTHEHLRHLHLPITDAFDEPEATSSVLMAQCSQHVIPAAIHSRPHQPADARSTRRTPR